MQRVHSRALGPAQLAAVRALLAARGLALARPPQNPYVAFEARTDGRSIFTAYTSGKLVSTVREGDAEGTLLEAAIAESLGEPPAAGGDRGSGDRGPGGSGDRAPGDAGAKAGPTTGAKAGAKAGAARVRGAAQARAPAAQGPRQGASSGLRWLAGLDETGTGELLGCAVVGGALLPVELAPDLAGIAGHVDTKAGRAASGWELLGEQLAALRPRGLSATVLPVPNRLFDRWSKNALLDLTYVRVVGDLLATLAAPGDPVRAAPAAGAPAAAPLEGLEIVIDDYGVGELLSRAIAAWRGLGASVLVETKADDRHLAARAASVLARSQRSREWQGLVAEVEDGPLGSGNAGHRETLAWLRRRSRAGLPWPAFVKTSFRTVRDLQGLPELRKLRVPPLHHLLDDDGAAAFLAGRLDLTRASLRAEGGAPLRRFRLDAAGRLVEPAGTCPAWELLPLLCGGVVLHARTRTEGVRLRDRLPEALVREGGLLSGWRVLVGPDDDAADPLLVAVARAHRAGVVCAVATAEREPVARAARHAGVLLSPEPRGWTLSLPG